MNNEIDIQEYKREYPLKKTLRMSSKRAKIFAALSGVIIFSMIFDLFLSFFMAEIATLLVSSVGRSIAIGISNNFDFYYFLLQIAFGLLWLHSIYGLYKEIKLKLDLSGLVGLKCQAGTFLTWFFIPLANLIMPWLALGALDRAARFAATKHCAGDLWTKWGHRGFSFTSAFCAMAFLFLSVVNSFIYTMMKAIQHPEAPVSSARAIEDAQFFSTVSAVTTGPLIITLALYFYIVIRNIRRIEAVVEAAPQSPWAR